MLLPAVTRDDQSHHFYDDSDPVWHHMHQDHPLLDTMIPWRLEWIARHCPPLLQTYWVDMGCGAGTGSLTMARLGANMIGVDNSLPALNQAKAQEEDQKKHLWPCASSALHHKAVHWVHADAHTWRPHPPLQAFVINGLCAWELLEHVPNPFALLAHWAYISQPGSYLVGSTLYRTWYTRYTHITVPENLLGWVPQGTHQWHRFFTPNDLETVLAYAGWHMYAWQKLGPVWSHLPYTLGQPQGITWQWISSEQDPISGTHNKKSPSFPWASHLFFAARRTGNP